MPKEKLETKEKFESPISRYVRQFCSVCPYWTKICNFVTEDGIQHMYVCIASANPLIECFYEMKKDETRKETKK